MKPTHVPVTLQMTDFDFHMLTQNTMAWGADEAWRTEHRNRFLPVHGEIMIRWYFDMAYWFRTWADVLLAREYIRAHGQEWQVLSDESAEPGSPYHFVIVTNFRLDKRE